MKTVSIQALTTGFFSISCILALAVAGCGKQTAESAADLVLKSGKIATVDSDFSFAEAVAVTGDRIAHVGTDAEIDAFIGPDTEVIDLDGRLVVPGLIDAHGHMLGYGNTLNSLDFRGTESFGEIIDMIAHKASDLPAGTWIRGRNWDQNDWPEEEFLPHDKLSAAVPDHPVYIVRVDGHAAIVNANAMNIAGVTAKNTDPDGGEILRKPDGDPTGVLIDTAMGLVARHIPDPTEEDVMRSLEMAAEGCLEVGLTGVHDAGVSPATVERYKRLIDDNRLGIRVFAMLGNPGENADVEEYLRKNRLPDYGDGYLKVTSIKLFIDGAMGSRGALMFEDYSDRPGYKGLLMLSGERALEISRAALATNCQVCTHAIGDHANRIIIEAYEQALEESPKPDHRFRIEHAQVMAPGDFQRVADLGILPSMQPTHATSDMYWAEDRIGPDRVTRSYALGEFLRHGCIIPCGSDFPVEENNPMYGVYAAITRKDAEGWPEGGWFPDQCMTREQVLKGFTIWAAHAAFQDDVLGSIETGKYADMVVLSDDILTVEPETILDTHPLYTIVGGQVKYKR